MLKTISNAFKAFKNKRQINSLRSNASVLSNTVGKDISLYKYIDEPISKSKYLESKKLITKLSNDNYTDEAMTIMAISIILMKNSNLSTERKYLLTREITKIYCDVCDIFFFNPFKRKHDVRLKDKTKAEIDLMLDIIVKLEKATVDAIDDVDKYIKKGTIEV